MSERKSLIRLASTMPVGSPERKALLAGLSKADQYPTVKAALQKILANPNLLRILRKDKADGRFTTSPLLVVKYKDSDTYEVMSESTHHRLGRKRPSIVARVELDRYKDTPRVYTLTS